MAQALLNDCSNSIEESSLLWIIFQPNTLADVAPTRGGFKDALDNMKEELVKEKTFHLPEFSNNYRNSAAISNINCDGERAKMWRMKDHITPLSSRFIGEIPKYLPIRKENVSECVKYVLDEYQKSGLGYENPTSNWVVLHSVGVDKEDIKKGLMKECKNPEEIVLFDGQEEIKELKNFLDNKNKKYLVISDVLFLGCEAPQIIYILNDDYFANHRAPILRAVEQLAIIHLVSDDYYNSVTFGNVRKDPQFLQCLQMKTKYKYVCETCFNKLNETKATKGEDDEEGEKMESKKKQFVVCTNCRYGCDHDDHSIKPIYKQFSKRKALNCMCNRFSSCKINQK